MLRNTNDWINHQNQIQITFNKLVNKNVNKINDELPSVKTFHLIIQCAFKT